MLSFQKHPWVQQHNHISASLHVQLPQEWSARHAMEFRVNCDFVIKLRTFDHTSGPWISKDEFKEFLVSGVRKYDNQKVRNVDRDIQRYIKIIHSTEYISLSDFIRFVYNNQKWSFCATICDRIEKALNFQLPSATSSLLDLYRKIAHEHLFFESIESFYLSLDVVKDLKCDTLNTDYCSHFSPAQWKRICLFEFHYNSLPDSKPTETYEDQLSKKKDYFEHLKTISGLSKSLQNNVSYWIQTQQHRTEDASRRNEASIAFMGNSVHRPAVLEKEIRDRITSTLSEFKTRIFCVDCSDECSSRHSSRSVHVIVELDDAFTSDDATIQFFTVVCKKSVERHNIPCGSITFVPIKCLPTEYKRFQVRDAILSKDIPNLCVKEVFDEEELHEDKACELCYNPSDCEPLNWREFCVETEFCKSVPLSMQILLGTFINQQSLKRAEDMSSYMHRKLVRLYSIFDNLLNLYNKKYEGVIQKLNAAELMVNYKSVKHMFRVSQEMGYTSGIDATERQWNKQSTSEDAYYNYSIIKIPLQYDSIRKGEGQHMVSLRDCVCINMIDNLVTVTH